MGKVDVKPLIAIVGNPNSGKTALFNKLTGSNQKVANYSGVTVERKEGILKTENGKHLRLLDLPGTYSLRARSPDEKVTLDVLSGNLDETPDVVMCVVDYTNLRQHMRLVMEVKSLGYPMIVVLNMRDIAEKRGYKIEAAKLSSILGVPVVTAVAVRKGGVDSLLKVFDEFNYPNTKTVVSQNKLQRFSLKEIDGILKQSGYIAGESAIGTQKIDKLLLHPVLGMLILLALLFVIFQAVFAWSELPMNAIDWLFSGLSGGVEQAIPDGLLRSFLIDGVIAGVGSVVIFLPQILILYFFILVLEDSGYMTRAAFLLDSIMARAGLHGKSFIPLLSSFACAIPGVMATRSISGYNDRIATIMAAPLMTCSARLPVYTLIIAAFVPKDDVLGMFNLQGLVMFGLYVAGLLSGLVVAYIYKKFISQRIYDAFVMEMPTYKLPSLNNILIGLWERAKIFLKRAGGVIFVLSIVVWFACTFPSPPEGYSEPAINHSYAGIIGKFLEPVFKPIGFDWHVVIALIPGMAAREVAVAALATVYAVGDFSESAVDSLAGALSASWTLPMALSFLAWYVYAPQCISTIAVVKRETNSWKLAGIMVFAYFALAYIAAFLTYNIALKF